MRVTDLLAMSMGSIVGNKLRSVLTLVGIVAGVASIIAVMTAIAVVQSTMEKEMSILGAQVFQVQKWPAGFNSDAQRRRAMRRPPLTLDDAAAIREQVGSVDLVGAELWDFGIQGGTQGRSDQLQRVHLRRDAGVPAQQHPLRRTGAESLADGRPGRTPRGRHRPRDRAASCSPSRIPIGKDIRLDGRKYQVIGVFDEKKSAFGSAYDNYVLIPISTFVQTYGMTNRDGFPRSVNITVRAKTPALIEDAMEETRQVLRRERGVKPGEEDNFEFFNSRA